MNLSLRVDEDPAVEHDHSSDREDGCRKQLYVDFLFHGAKVLQKREATKKVTSRIVVIFQFSNLGSNRTRNSAKIGVLRVP